MADPEVRQKLIAGGNTIVGNDTAQFRAFLDRRDQEVGRRDPRRQHQVGRMTTGATRPLEGVRVLDLSRVLAGPTAAQTLADLGAEVIKIERPAVGDDTRLMGPHFQGDTRAWSTARPISGQSIAARSRWPSISPPPRAPTSCAVSAPRADVVIENFKVGALDRYGLGVADLAAINPRLVYCSITGFGQTGPYRQRAGYDSIIQAVGGLMSITGEPDGSPGGGPQRGPACRMIDIMTGLSASTRDPARRCVIATAAGRASASPLALLDVVGCPRCSYFGVSHLPRARVPQRAGTRNPVTSSQRHLRGAATARS